MITMMVVHGDDNDDGDCDGDDDNEQWLFASDNRDSGDSKPPCM